MINKYPKVTIIIPVYNSEKYLDQSIRSVLEQTYSNLEVLLINDGSTDSSGGICEKYAQEDDRLTVFYQENKGVSSARNFGITKANGEFISFVDCDDWLEKSAVEEMVELAQSSQSDCVRMHYREVSGGRSKSVPLKAGPGFYEGEELDGLKCTVATGKLPAYVWLLLIKKEKLDAEQLRFDSKLTLMEDYLFYIKLLDSIDSIVLSDKVTYNYLINPSSASRSIDKILRNAEDTILVNTMVRQYFPKEVQRAINAVHANRIATSLLAAYQPSPKGMFRVLGLSSSIRATVEYSRLVSEADLSGLAVANRLTVKALCNGWGALLLLMLGVKSGINYIKDQR